MGALEDLNNGGINKEDFDLRVASYTSLPVLREMSVLWNVEALKHIDELDLCRKVLWVGMLNV